jgi:pyridoxamine 5'-phosphate oxidase
MLPIIETGDSLDKVLYNAQNQLRRGAADPKHPYHQVSFSTVHQNMTFQRTVILRKIDEHFNFWFYTDYRSKKVLHLKLNPYASLLFYNPRNRCQISIQVRVSIHHSDALAQEIFKKIPSISYRDYGMPLPPGTATDEANVQMPFSAEEAKKNFTLLIARPQHVEVLQLGRESHSRAIFKRESESWLMQWLLP